VKRTVLSPQLFPMVDLGVRAWHYRRMADNDRDELLAYVRVAVGSAHGLTEAQSRRLVGSSLRALHDDAATMAGELGIEDPYTPDTGPARDGAGRFAASRGGASGDMNRIIREASGRR
jgi:hypothetical protein